MPNNVKPALPPAAIDRSASASVELQRLRSELLRRIIQNEARRRALSK